MSLLIRRLLLAATAIQGLFDRNAGTTEVRNAYDPPTPRSAMAWGRSHWGWRRAPKPYSYSGRREEQRAAKRLAFKAANGRFP